MTGDERRDADAVLRARAERLARPVETDDAEPSRLVLVLRAGEMRLALPLDRVAAVLAPSPAAAVPDGDHRLAGLRTWGGELLAIADLGDLLGATSPAAMHERYVVVLADEHQPLGVLADEVEGIGDIRSTGSPGPADSGSPAVRLTSDGVVLLDADEVLTDPRLSTVAPSPD